MKIKTNALWDSAAAAAKAKVKPDELYIGQSILDVVNIAFRHVGKNGLTVLKTDLWNEGIETNRDVLGRLEDAENTSFVAVDISRTVCRFAKDCLSKSSIVQADILNMPFKPDSFDAVLDLSTIDHIPADRIHAVMDEYQRVTKKFGILLLLFWRDSEATKLIQCRRRNDPFFFPPYQFFLPIQRVKTLLSQRRFLPVYECFMLGWGGQTLSDSGRRSRTIISLIRKMVLHTRYSQLFAPLLKLFAGQFAIIARRTDH
jgi:SAM-dependent methyltransferase